MTAPRPVPSTPSHVTRFLKGGAGGLSAAVVLLAIPFAGHHLLPDAEYVRWALLSTVATVGLGLDFGGAAYAGARTARGGDPVTSAAAGGAMTAAGVAVVTGAAALVWPHLEAGAAALAGQQTGSALVVAVGAACVLRGLVLAGAGALLGARRYGARGLVALAQAVLQLAVVLVWLSADPDLRALPISIAASSALVLPVLALQLRRSGGAGQDLPEPARRVAVAGHGAARFALLKGTATGLSLLLTQVDRWVLALVAPPGLLGTYDLAARLAAVPKLLVLMLLAGAAAEAARADATGTGLRHLQQEAQRLGRRVVVVASAALLVGAGIVLVRGSGSAWPALTLVAAVLVWNGVHALTAPRALVLTGLGRPGEEVRYLLLAVSTAVSLWVAGLLCGSTGLVLLAPGTGLLVGSSWFLLRGRRHPPTDAGEVAASPSGATSPRPDDARPAVVTGRP